ncbi:MAG TPA: CvpA family protein [Candidatus Competibacteraceae bacterium]|nr:CvpA family protein [Candidatus Competibacteraceae bacterium]
MEGFTWADYVILAVVGLSVLMSLWRGFLTEVISLATWIAAFIVAFLFMDEAAVYLADRVAVPSVRAILAFGGLFLATLLVGGLCNVIVNQLVRKTGLSGTDRLLGLFFGLVRGIAIVSVLVLLSGLTPLPQDPWWKQSVLLPHFQPLANWLQGFLPPSLAEGLRNGTLPLPAMPAIPASPTPANPAAPVPPAAPPAQQPTGGSTT